MKKLIATYHTQRNNKRKPYITCYNTSMATGIDYILKLQGKDKTTIGCPINMQLDDYLYDIIYSKETKKWIKDNAGRFGAWFLSSKPHTLAAVECYVFNKLMNSFGYKAEFLQNQTFNDFVNLINNENVPQILHGYFKPETRVGGHVIVGIGYEVTSGSFICHDPYGDAKTKYVNKKGANVVYKNNHWFHHNDTSIWITAIKRI
ncbi:MAG: C39 family peptidase [Candidatus Thorarchaeota archaeon]